MVISGPTRITLALIIAGSIAIWDQSPSEMARISPPEPVKCEPREREAVVRRPGCNSPGVNRHFIRPGTE